MSNELRLVKWVRFFKQNCTVKYVIFFVSFCWLLHFLLESLKLKKKSDDIQWNVWTNIKTLYARNNIFKKRIRNIRFLNHLYFGPSFAFQGTALGGFSLWFFFSPSANRCVRHFCSDPHTIKKLPTALIIKITGIITLSVDRYSQTGNQDQQVHQMLFILLGTVPVNNFSNTTIKISL